ncbi:MAG TPA: VOC family protein [Steroidobacteraceae bacterium]|nr:VOC family protein [Steroidobacteraceae bacterium]
MAHAPLPPPGRFHEVSLATDDIRASVEFYERLGFSQTVTTDTYAHPYGVLTDGRVYIGLHQRRAATPTLTFVRPGVAASLAEFTALGIELTVCRTGEEVFNEIGFEGPHGESVRVIEARTYSPAVRSRGEVSLCGDFAQLSLPATDFAAARDFWEPLGFVATDEAEAPYGHLPLTSDTLELAFHRPRTFAAPLLVFRAADMRARIERLRSLGVAEESLPRGIARETNALLSSPEGTQLLLLSDSE